jgi:hypothetical protein
MLKKLLFLFRRNIKMKKKTLVDNPDRQYRCLTSINNQKTIESWRRHTEAAVKNIEVRDYVSSIPSGAVRL